MNNTNNDSEKIAYINGLLDAVGTLNSIHNHDLDFGFVALSGNESREDSLKNYLETPNWTFGFQKMDDWKATVTEDTLWDFILVIMQINGGLYPLEVGEEKFKKQAQDHNLLALHKKVFDSIDAFLSSKGTVSAYQIEIKMPLIPDNTGYFAHAENNYLFETGSGERFFFYVRVSN